MRDDPGGRELSKIYTNHVRAYREARMMSKAELARKAGLSSLTIDRLEAGRPCRLDTKRKLLAAFGLKVVDRAKLFGDSPRLTTLRVLRPGVGVDAEKF